MKWHIDVPSAGAQGFDPGEFDTQDDAFDVVVWILCGYFGYDPGDLKCIPNWLEDNVYHVYDSYNLRNVAKIYGD